MASVLGEKFVLTIKNRSSLYDILNYIFFIEVHNNKMKFAGLDVSVVRQTFIEVFIFFAVLQKKNTAILGRYTPILRFASKVKGALT